MESENIAVSKENPVLKDKKKIKRNKPKTVKTIMKEQNKEEKIFNENFITSLSLIIARYFLPVYLSSLIIAYFYCTSSVEIEANEIAANAFDISNRICAYYMIVVVVLGFLWQMMKYPLLNIFAVIGLIFAYVTIWNLFLTAFSHFFTYLIVLNKVNDNDQTLVRSLFDTRMIRRPSSKSIFGRLFEGTSLDKIGNVIDNLSANFFSATWDAFSYSITGIGCNNSWGGINGTLLWEPVNISFSENVVGKFAWWSENAIIENKEGFGSCSALYILRFFNNYVFGITTSDEFFSYVIEASIPSSIEEENIKVSDGALFLKNNGIACTGTDFSYFIANLQDLEADDVYYGKLYTQTATANAANKREGLPRRLQDVDFDITRLKDDDRKFLDDEIDLFFEKLNIRLESQNTVGFYLDNSKKWSRLGLNLSYLFDAHKKGKISKNDLITPEHAKAMVGVETELYGIKIKDDIFTQDEITKGIKGFGTAKCDFGYIEYSCCDIKNRPFQINKLNTI